MVITFTNTSYKLLLGLMLKEKKEREKKKKEYWSSVQILNQIYPKILNSFETTIFHR